MRYDGLVKCPFCKSPRFTPCVDPYGKARLQGSHLARVLKAAAKGFNKKQLKAMKKKKEVVYGKVCKTF